MTSKRDEDKARREREIFNAFAIAANLKVEPASAISAIPDIFCSIQGHRHKFELTQVVDPDLAENVALTYRDAESRGGFYSGDKPLIKAFRSKLEKSYSVSDGKLELLAYYEIQEYDPFVDPATKEELDQIASEMLRKGWYRLWLYDSHSNRIILRIP